MAKKDKAKKAEKKARTAQKQEKKATQKEKKGKNKRGPDEDSDAEDVDLDAVLAEYARQQEQFLKVTEAVCEPPSPRSSATLLASPTNANELLLFGGEYFNGALARFYNDLFVYNVGRDEWRLVTSPNTPLPRSGHAWTRGANDKAVYLFGGEFSSPKQGTFYHYNDFWRLDAASREWAKVEAKGKGPPARSGHRMAAFKNYVVLFGGFQDTSSQTRYLQDLWVYDTARFEWFEPKLPPATQRPDPRSSFTLLPHEQGAVLYGGYSRVKGTTSTRPMKGGAGHVQAVLKPVVHTDTWFLRITPPGDDAPANALPVVRWERRKKPANAPNPPRAGATMAYHKGRGIQFGGVHDMELSEEGIDSEFFNTLFVWNVERNRYFSLGLRRPRQGQKKAVQAGEGGRRGKAKADEEELLQRLAALEAKDGASTGIEPSSAMAKDEKEDEATAPEKPVVWEMPHPRFNAQLAVQDDVLYIFGGTFEKGNREFTFDELWSIDLGKLDGVKEIFKRELQDWVASDDEESSDEDGENDSEEDEEDEEAGEEMGAEKANEENAPIDTSHGAEESPTASTLADEPSQATESSLSDTLPHPRPFETLRDFYARTSQAWQEVLLEELNRGAEQTGAGKSIKEVRKGAFERAEEKWWDCREEIRALEDEQEAAGIGEVVNLGEKQSATSSGVGRRR